MLVLRQANGAVYFSLWQQLDEEPPVTGMSTSGIKEVLESNHGQLVECLSQEANHVLEEAKSILNKEELELVMSQRTNVEKVSMLLNRLMTKDNDTCKKFIEMLIIIMPCNSFPMCLENLLMTAGDDNTEGVLFQQGNESNFDNTSYSEVESSAKDISQSGRKRKAAQVESLKPTEVKRLRKGNRHKAAALKSSSMAAFTNTMLTPDPEEMDNTLLQTGEEYLNLPAISDFAEDYRSLLVKIISQKYEANMAKADQMKQVTLDQTFRSLTMKDGNVAKLKERIDASRDDVLSSQGLEENQDEAVNLVAFLSKKHVSNYRVNILLGKAGTGKTKLMHKICYEWARGAISQFQYVFLFEFRQLNLINKNIDLKSMLFDLFLQPERNSHAVFRFIIRNPQKILILFDGFDEFAGKASVHNLAVSSNPNAPLSVGQLFSSLYNGKLLPGCTILITSRPKDILCLSLDVVGQVGEVSGFNQCKIKEYAGRFFKDSEHNCQATSHLQKNMKILNMCYIPALCWVVFLCLEHLLSQSHLEPKLPHTMTQFYIKMLTVFLRKGSKIKETTETLLLNNHREEIHGLCNLAIKGLQESKSVFYLRDLLSEKVTNFASSYGFLTTFEVKTIDQNQENGHAFVHLTLQEFLAALHQMIDNKITDQMLKRRFYLKSKWTSKNDMKNEFTDAVHIFLSGLASKECKQFLSILASKNEVWVQKKQKAILQNLRKLATTNLTGPKIIELCHCVYETHDCDLARDVAAHLKYKFELRNFRLTPADMTVLTFVINSGASCICLDIGGCAMDLECVAVLGTCKNVEVLIFKSRKYEDKFAGTLSEIIPQVNSLKKLILTSCSISLKGVTHLSSALKTCHHLEEINLHDNELGDVGIATVVDALPQTGSLRKIELGCNDITVQGVLTIANAISTCSNILDIQVSDGGNVATIRFFAGSTSIPINRSSRSLSPAMEYEGSHEAMLRRLSLVNCTLAAEHVQTLSIILQRCPQLASLDLSGNELKDDGLRRLVEILPSFHISKLINLSNNGISEDGILCLATVLKKCPRMLEVEVSLKHHQTVLLKFSEQHEDTEVRDELNAQLVDFRLSSTGDSKTMPGPLRKLSLTNCHFQLKHLEELGSTLENCNDLAELDLSNNSLGDGGFRKLVELLPKLHVSRLINVSNNFISLAGALCLAGCLKMVRNITEVAISLGKSGKGLIKFHGKYRFQQEKEFQESSEVLSLGAKYGKQDLCVPKKISLEECEMDGETMGDLCLVLEQCSGLTELDLSNNALSDEAITKLLDHLPKLRDLKILNITDSIIAPDTILLLANSLNICENVLEVKVRASRRASISFMKRVYRLEGNGKKPEPPCSRILSLKECNLDKRSVEKLFKILEHCKDLTELDLSSNLLGDEGLQCLRDFLPKLHVLKLMDVSNNRISSAGVLYLVESLNTCRNVVEVEVSLASNCRSLIKFVKRCGKKVCNVKECRFKKEELVQFFSIIEQCTHLTELNLACNMLGDEGLRNLTEVMANLKDLKELNLQKNGISLVAMENLLMALKDCPKALTVRFEECWIYGADAANLVVKCVCTHMKIEDIRVKNNKVLIRLVDNSCQSAVTLQSDYDSTRMDTGAQHPSLRLISLYQCGIEAPQLLHLSSIIKQCPHLLELHLHQINIGNKGAETLAEILHIFQGLRKLSLESINISTKGMVTMAAGLCKCRSIEEINLSQNELGEEGATELGKILPGLEQLKKINLSRILTDAGLIGTNRLAKGLSNCTRLEEINLDSLMLKDSGVQLLAEGILRMMRLKKLNLRSNAIGCQGAAHLANGLKHSTGIVEIDLCGNCIEDVGAMKLADVLPVMKSLKTLNLTQNNITATGGEMLAEALRQCPSLEEIHLSTNKIGDQTATKLAQALPKLPCLKILNLHCSELSADGGISLAQGLVHCPSLEEISLPENNIGNKGVMELAMALRVMKLLKKLDLQLNSLDDSVAEKLAAGLVCCPCIEEVILSWNNISDEGAMRLAEVLPRMLCLKKLDLEGNKITAAGAEKLAASLQQCSFIEAIRLWKNSISKDREQNLQEQDPRLNFFSV
ncbi:NLR family, CARD domain containing 5 isoform X1 [Heterodontus francisci]|uniref:NLR family, CARD domain containing 5 isoform X1 n=2 Tax=Heterodontus francisci TaxID=7792 RepID=UPI00355B949D